jgi:hypothetical protein
MKCYLTVIALSVATINAHPQEASSAPKATPTPGKCVYTKDTKSFPNPLDLFPPGSAVFPCDMGAGVPLGPVPKGCAQLEIIAGKVYRLINFIVHY